LFELDDFEPSESIEKAREIEKDLCKNTVGERSSQASRLRLTWNLYSTCSLWIMFRHLRQLRTSL